MSEKDQDERDIDEVLASIDAMLKQKDSYFEDLDKKSSVSDAAAHSEKALGLSTSLEAGVDHVDFQQSQQPRFILTDDDFYDDAQASSAGEITAETEAGFEAKYTDESNESDMPIQAEATTTEYDDAHHPSFDAFAEVEENIADVIAKEFKAETAEEKYAEEMTEELEESFTELEQEFTHEHSVATPRHRILLTESLLETSNQRPLPLWLDVTDDKPDTPPDAPTQISAEASVQDEPAATNTAETEHNQDQYDEKSESLENALSANDNGFSEDPFPLSQEKTSADESDCCHGSELEQNDDVGDISEVKLNINDEDLDKNQEKCNQSSLKNEDDKPIMPKPETLENSEKYEFDAVFAAIANDDTITFDVSEAYDEDTVFGIEMITENELLEALVEDASSNIPTDENQAYSELDAAVEAAKAEEEARQRALEAASMAALLPPLSSDELASIAQTITAKVSIELNQHLQAILPALIQDEIKCYVQAAKDKQDKTTSSNEFDI